MNEPDNFDALLDQALVDSAEPPDGLEDRVLRRAKSAKRARILYWSFAPLAAALAITVFLLFPSAPASRKDRARISVPAPTPAAEQPAIATAHPAAVHALVIRHRRAAAQTEASLASGTPLPIFVRPDAQERALRVALTQPGFLAALDAAQAVPKDWNKNQNPDAPESDTAPPEPRP
ncbi:MAG: hypothetical protein WCC14_04000 [Acidobacteriaceae bacterium]